MNNEKLKHNLASPSHWLRLLYMVLFAVLLEIAGFVMLAVIVMQFLFSIVTGSPNDNLRRLGDQVASFIFQALQFLIYNTEEKPFPFSEWPESEAEDLSSYESAEEVDGEVISDEDDGSVIELQADKPEVDEPSKTSSAKSKPGTAKGAKGKSTKSDDKSEKTESDS